MDYNIVVVGAGISGLSFTRAYAEKNPDKKIIVFERRDHIAGNCHDYIDENNILVQKYGPHIFHTENKRVWDFLSRFTDWSDYRHRVFAKHQDEYYPIPINRTTINKFFNLDLKTDEDVEGFLKTKALDVGSIKNSKDVVVSRVGTELYDAFIKGLTKKQWGVYPDQLPPYVLERLPIRLDEKDNYFNDEFQGMPLEGYTNMCEKMIDLPNIEVVLNQDFNEIKTDYTDQPVVYTGRIDEYYDNRYGELKYRAIKFVIETKDIPSYQPYPVVNHPDKEDEYSRVAEYQKFSDGESDKTTICKEYPGKNGPPTYPVPDDESKKLFEKYNRLKTDNIHFLGRLGKYKYLDIDDAVLEALEFSDKMNDSP